MIDAERATVSRNPFACTWLQREDRTPTVRLVANSDYWDKRRGPHLQEVVFRNDLSRERALDLVCTTEGKVDILTEVSPVDAGRVEGSEHAKLVSIDAVRAVVGVINRDAEGLPHTRWWTLSRSEGKRTEILAVLRRGEKVLPVFGHEEEAELYLWLAGLGEGWRVRESRCGELVSALCGPCVDVKSVALDPLPQMIEDGTLALSCWSRREFVRALTGGSGHEARPRSPVTLGTD